MSKWIKLHFCFLFTFHMRILCICFLSVCHRGYFNCSYSPCPAVCTVYSDRHYHTFDGLEYDYHSDCQVYLLKVSGVVCNLVLYNVQMDPAHLGHL